MIETLGGFIVTFLVKFLLGWLSDKRSDAAQKEIGRVTAERDQAVEGLTRQRELSDIAASPPSDDEVDRRLREGSA